MQIDIYENETKKSSPKLSYSSLSERKMIYCRKFLPNNSLHFLILLLFWFRYFLLILFEFFFIFDFDRKFIEIANKKRYERRWFIYWTIWKKRTKSRDKFTSICNTCVGSYENSPIDNSLSNIHDDRI